LTHFKIHFSRIYREILGAGVGSFQSISSKVAFIEETALISQILIHNEKRRNKKNLFIYFYISLLYSSLYHVQQLGKIYLAIGNWERQL
jgi:hypothetical protein